MLGLSLSVYACGASSIILAGAHHIIHSGVPLPVLPDAKAIPELLVPSLSLTILGLSFGAGVAQAYPGPDGGSGNPSRDFFGRGVANLASSLFQCIPSSGSMSRTAYLVESGAKTRWAHVFTGITMLAVVLTIADLAERIPLAVVAGVLMVIGYTAIDRKRLRLIWQINRVERTTMLLTAVLTIVLSPPIAILIGMALSFLGFIEASANSIALTYLARDENGRFTAEAMPEHFSPDAVTSARLPVFRRHRAHRESTRRSDTNEERRTCPKLPRLQLHRQRWSHLSGRFARRMASVGNSFFLADVSPRIEGELKRTPILDELGAENVFAGTADPHESLARAFAAAHMRIVRKETGH